MAVQFLPVCSDLVSVTATSASYAMGTSMHFAVPRSLTAKHVAEHSAEVKTKQWSLAFLIELHACLQWS